jgi:hypothetical protein
LPNYRTGTGRNDIKQDFIGWLVSSYLPTTSHYKDRQVEPINAKSWICNKEKEGNQEEVEERYEQMLKKQSSQKVPASADRPPLTEEEQAWIALTSEIQHACPDWQDVSVVVTLQNGLWITRSNLPGCSGRLGEVMARFPLASLPSNFSDWYLKCYDRAKKKSPHLPLPEPLAKQPKVS